MDIPKSRKQDYSDCLLEAKKGEEGTTNMEWATIQNRLRAPAVLAS